MYPLAQAEDSFYLKSDVKYLTDQKFNLAGLKQVIFKNIKKTKFLNLITMPLLEGIDGVEKIFIHQIWKPYWINLRALNQKICMEKFYLSKMT